MPTHFAKRSDAGNAPLYTDLFEFIDVMGIKQSKVIEAFGIGRSYWYKLRQQHLNGISLEHMHRFATYFGLPPGKVMDLCYTTYLRGLQRADRELAPPYPPTTPAASPLNFLDSDFPPID